MYHSPACQNRAVVWHLLQFHFIADAHAAHAGAADSELLDIG
jgi:hypothetical protein